MEVHNFDTDVIEASYMLPILVDFYAEWCQPCQYLTPILEKLESSNNDQWKLMKVNVDEHSEISTKYNIMGIPAVKLFYQGGILDEFQGVMPESSIAEWLDKILSQVIDSSLYHEAVLKYQEGEMTKAEIIMRNHIKKFPNDDSALVQLAKWKLWKHPEQVKELLVNLNETSDIFQEVDSLRLLALFLTEPHIIDKLPDSPSKKFIMNGYASLTENNIEDAIPQFIDAIIVDKPYQDELARKLVLALFHYLGPKNPITIKYRKRFDMSLY